MEITWITENYYPNKGGMAQSCDRIVNGLRKSGCIVNILHFSNRHQKIEIQKQWNGFYFALPTNENYPHSLQLGYKIIEKYLKNNQKLVAFGGFLPILCIEIYAAWLNLPYFVCIRGNDFDAAIFHYQRREILRKTLENAVNVITNTSEKAQKINQFLKSQKTVFIPNGIEENWLPSQNEQKYALIKKNRLRPLKIIGLFGQLKEKKGTLLFLECVNHANLKEKFHFIIAGELEENVLNYLENHYFSYEKLNFIERYQLIEHYLTCDWIVIPSYYDGMPNVLLESMALGVPVFASNVDGMKDVIKHLQNGLLYENLNSADLIQNLTKILEMNLTTYQTICNSAYETARNEYNESIEIERYKKIFFD